MKTRPNKNRYAAPALEQALKIIDFMSQDGAERGINEISRELGISVNMAYRILIQLANYGYAELAATGKYRLSTKLFTIGMRLYSRFDLRLRSRPHLEQLCEATTETCQIQIPDKDHVIVLDCITPNTDCYLKTVPGSRFYYHANAFGKAILAFMEESALYSIIPKKLPVLTKNTITTRQKLLEELDKIRQTGLAYDREEYLSGLYCIGAPVFDVNEKVAAGLGITGIISRLTPGYAGTLRQGESDRRHRYEALVLNCAEQVSRDIGYEGDQYDKFKKMSAMKKANPLMLKTVV
ncbi:MAG: IclR family transcriptional regulator [Kiritimatiellaeota bacterium]|nr:IclR family transcriptional regulator [Kiritimatiellota bacterium]